MHNVSTNFWIKIPTLRPYLESNEISNGEFLENGREKKGNNYPRAEVFKFFMKEKIVKSKKAIKTRKKGHVN